MIKRLTELQQSVLNLFEINKKDQRTTNELMSELKDYGGSKQYFSAILKVLEAKKFIKKDSKYQAGCSGMRSTVVRIK